MITVSYEAGIFSKPHGAAFFSYLMLLIHQVNHTMRSLLTQGIQAIQQMVQESQVLLRQQQQEDDAAHLTARQADTVALGNIHEGSDQNRRAGTSPAAGRATTRQYDV